MSYTLHVLIMIGLYLMVAYSLNLVVGFGGLLSLCHAVFYGIGAYTYALLSLGFDLPFPVALMAAVVMNAVLGGLIALPALRFRGDMFVFVTLGVQMIVFTVLYNWVGLTGGPYGIPGIPRPGLLGLTVRGLPAYLVLVVALDALILPLLYALYQSPFGLTLKALREDERAASALGVCPTWIYGQAMALAAAFAAVPGVLYASYVTYIDPTSFTLQESIFIVAILLLGGSGNRLGPLVGVTLMLLLPEALRFVGLPDAIGPNVREITYGVLLIVLMYWRPQGIAGEFKVR
jgi:branched-chain amino acid transport system permease protein